MNLDAFIDDFLHTDGFQVLAKDIFELLDCPVMITDVAFRVIAWHHSGSFFDPPFQDSVEKGELSYEIGSAFLGDHPGVRPEAQYIELARSPYRRRLSALHSGGIHVGYLILVDVHGTLEKEDPAVFARIEAVLAKQLRARLSRDSQLQNTEEAILLHLLEGRFANEPMFRLQAAGTALADFAPVRFALLSLEYFRPERRNENALRTAVTRLFPDSRVLIFRGSVLAFLRSEPDLHAVSEACEKFRLHVVISAKIRNLFHLPQLYAAAQEIMEFLHPHMPEAFAVYAEPYYGLLMLRALSSRRDLILPSVRALERQDIDEGSSYCLTLYTYLCCHHSLQETCAQLFTHRNTVLYRMRKMKEEFGIPLDDPGQYAALLMSSGLALLNLQPNRLLPQFSSNASR